MLPSTIWAAMASSMLSNLEMGAFLLSRKEQGVHQARARAVNILLSVAYRSAGKEILHSSRHFFTQRLPAILITGGLGFIGSHVCVELLLRNYHIIIIDDLSNSYDMIIDNILSAYHTRADHPGIRSRNSLPHYECDFGDSIIVNRAITSMKETFEIRGVIHLAASKSVSESIIFPEKYYHNNVRNTATFLEVLGRHKINNIVFASSAAVYANSTSQASSLLEEHMQTSNINTCKTLGTKHLSPYGISKALGEFIVNRWTSDNPERRSVIFRIFNPVGCDPSGNLGDNPKDASCAAGLMSMIAKTMKDDNSYMNIYGTDYDTTDGTCIRDFVHVGDIANGIVAGMETCISRKSVTLSGCRTYNLASGKGSSVRQIIEAIEKVSGHQIKIQNCNRRIGDIAISIGEIDKVIREVGWQPQRSLDDICQDFCRRNDVQCQQKRLHA